jgi:hypothetical protein
MTIKFLIKLIINKPAISQPSKSALALAWRNLTFNLTKPTRDGKIRFKPANVGNMS